MSSNEWQWQYKDCLKSNSKLPTFKIEGIKKFFGFYRTSIESSQLKRGCIIFFQKIDHSLLHFANELSTSFKTSDLLGKNQTNIFVFVACNSLNEFDEKTKQAPKNIQLFADIGGNISEQFGMKPLMNLININDIISDQSKRKYEKQTLNGTFFFQDGLIIKSPAYQPKLQSNTIGILKSCFEYLEKNKYDLNVVTSKGSFAEDLTEKEIQSVYKKSWDLYLQEYEQMLEDLGQKKKIITTEKKKKKKKKKKKVEEEVPKIRSKL
eukprot:gene5840-9663_t